MPTNKRYAHIKKPSWSPPAWVFGPVWTFLYVLIVISFGKIFLMARSQEITFMVALPFVLNLIFNLLFSPIQFRRRNNEVASIDIVLILGTLIWGMIVAFSYIHRVTYLQIPYLLWVSFATILQLTITYLNRRK